MKTKKRARLRWKIKTEPQQKSQIYTQIHEKNIYTNLQQMKIISEYGQCNGEQIKRLRSILVNCCIFYSLLFSVECVVYFINCRIRAIEKESETVEGKGGTTRIKKTTTTTAAAIATEIFARTTTFIRSSVRSICKVA